MNHAELIEAVKEMRLWQKEYFKTRSKEALLKAKEFEKKVDEMLDAQKTEFDF